MPIKKKTIEVIIDQAKKQENNISQISEETCEEAKKWKEKIDNKQMEEEELCDSCVEDNWNEQKEIEELNDMSNCESNSKHSSIGDDDESELEAERELQRKFME